MYLYPNGMLVLMADTGNSTQFKMPTVTNNGDRITKPSCAPGTGTIPPELRRPRNRLFRYSIPGHVRTSGMSNVRLGYRVASPPSGAQYFQF